MYEIKIFKPCRRTVAIHDYYEDGTEIVRQVNLPFPYIGFKI